MFRRKATSTNSDELMTISLRRGFCPVALLQPSPDSSTVTTENQSENIVGSVSTVKAHFQASIPHSIDGRGTTTMPTTEKDKGCEQKPEQMDSFNNIDSSANKHFQVLYSKKSTRKNKKWEEDGFLTISKNNSYGVLRDVDCKVISSGGFRFTEDMIGGYELFQFGGKDVKIDVPLEEREAQRLFQHTSPLNYDGCVVSVVTALPTTAKDKDLDSEQKPTEQIVNLNNLDSSANKHYRVTYAKMSMRKNKKWESDGFLTISKNNSYGVLRDEDGKVINSGGFCFTEDMIGGYDLVKFGGKDLRIGEPLEESEAQRLFNK